MKNLSRFSAIAFSIDVSTAHQKPRINKIDRHCFKIESINNLKDIKYVITRKYPLFRCILGVLTHTTAWDWGGDESLK